MIDVDAAPSMASGPFALKGRTLFRNGAPIKVGARALEILIALAEKPGQLVTKGELLDRVWPNQQIEEAALRVHLSALRRLLAADGAEQMIVNESGRGYRLVAPILEPSRSEAGAASFRTTLPQLLSRVVGRDEIIDRLVNLIPAQRLVTIAGPGGIGKTTIALATAARVLEVGERVVIFVDLASLTDIGTAPAVLAEGLGLASPDMEGLAGIISALDGVKMLMILDNCEHMIEAVASLAETLLRSLPDLAILATSRERMAADGEWVERAPALALPVSGIAAALQTIAESPAVQLFIDRARLAADFELTFKNAPLVAKICQKLDGIPLAIEMAAARLSTMSLSDVDRLLVDRFALLTTGRRTALPRHRTLRAAMDWSFELLDSAERDLFTRLCLFRTAFSIQAAMAMASPNCADAGKVLDLVSALAAKSLLIPEEQQGETRYRILETIRVYGAQQLELAPYYREACAAYGRLMLGKCRAPGPACDPERGDCDRFLLTGAEAVAKQSFFGGWPSRPQPAAFDSGGTGTED